MEEVRPREEGAELRMQAEVRVHTHRFLLSILQEVTFVCVCTWVCVDVYERVRCEFSDDLVLQQGDPL